MKTIDQEIPKSFDLKCFHVWVQGAVEKGFCQDAAIDLVFDYQVALCNDDYKTRGDLIEYMSKIADEFDV